MADPIAWAHESFDLARHAAYLDGKIVGVTKDQAGDNPDSVPPLPAGYEVRAREVADQQIALAGYRLADLLQSMLTSTQPTTRP